MEAYTSSTAELSTGSAEPGTQDPDKIYEGGNAETESCSFYSTFVDSAVPSSFNASMIEMATNEGIRTQLKTLTTLNDLKESTFHLLIRCLNYSDITQCRLVCTHWNQMVKTSDYFLSKVVINATLESDNLDMMTKTKINWTNTKLKYFDFENTTFLQPFSPSSQFFTFITFLEFHQCDILWDSFKKFVIYASKNLQHLGISKCTIYEAAKPVYTNLNEAEFTKVMNQITSLTLVDGFNISGLTSHLNKLIHHNVNHLTKLKIEFQPFSEPTEESDAENFSVSLSEIIKLNSTTLEVLVLNLRSTELINAFCPIVLTNLEPFYEGMRLQTFKLTTPIAELNNSNPCIITSHVSSSFLMFLEFLRSQRELKSVAFPHFSNLGSQELRRTQLVESLDSSRLEKLRLPGHVYLKKNFLKIYGKLKVLFVGDKCGLGYSATFNPTKYMYDNQSGKAGITCRHIRQLGVFSKLSFGPGILFHIVEKFPNLVVLEVDGLASTFNDADVQTIVKYLSALQILSITGCELITDSGISGVPKKLCQEMFSLSLIYTNDLADLLHRKLADGNIRDLNSGGRGSLASLTGLRTLRLIGTSQITDVGIALGIQFKELKCLHLPWSERISDWGINKIGKYNPSLESFTLTGTIVSAVQQFNLLVSTHPRLQRRLCRILKVYPDSTNPEDKPTFLTGILSDTSEDLVGQQQAVMADVEQRIDHIHHEILQHLHIPITIHQDLQLVQEQVLEKNQEETADTLTSIPDPVDKQVVSEIEITETS